MLSDNSVFSSSSRITHIIALLVHGFTTISPFVETISFTEFYSTYTDVLAAFNIKKEPTKTTANEKNKLANKTASQFKGICPGLKSSKNR